MAGFIGSACAREFLARSWHVTGLVHHHQPQGLQGIDTIAGSLAERDAVLAALADRGPFDVIINCAGIASDIARRGQLMRINYEGVRNLIEGMRSSATGRLVHVSSTDVYGLRDFDAADESTPLDNNRHNAYPASKILAEQAITASLPAERYAILRPAAVCGQGDRTLLPRLLAFLRGSPCLIYFGRWHGKNRWPLANVRNVARAAYLAATCDEAAGQAYNVLDPPIVSVADYMLWVVKTFLPHKVGMKSICIPTALCWLPAKVSSVLSAALGTREPIFEPTLYALYTVASDLNFSTKKLAGLFAARGERFADSCEGCTVA